MQQYHELKARYPQELLFFRLGDFYELFDEDAKRAAPLLEVALTHRQQVPMCGVPAHAVDPYIGRLLKRGLRVAIAEQLEDPALVKGLVKRDVVRVITPGTLQEEALLSSKRSNYLVAVTQDHNRMGLAAIEYSTGEFIATEIDNGRDSKGWDEIKRLSPSEVLMESAANDLSSLKERLQKEGMSVTELSPIEFSIPVAKERFRNLFGTASVGGFGLEDKPLALSAAGAAARYIERTQCGRPYALRPVRTYSLDDYLLLDASTVDHLDIVGDRSTSSKTLLGVIDHTLTPMGSRLIRRWLLAPLKKVNAIQERQCHVDFFVEAKETRRRLRSVLQGWPDTERILTRVRGRAASPRDLASLGQGLQRAGTLKSQLSTAYIQSAALGPTLPAVLQNFLCEFPEEPALASILAKALVDTPPLTLKNGGVIRAGFDPELDEVRSWIHQGKAQLLEIEKRERDHTGISSLKVGFNNIFGYYLEVTRPHLARVPARYIRKQTLSNVERFVTPELKDFETKVLGAEERAFRLETALVQNLCEQVLAQWESLQTLGLAVAALDVFLSLAEVAERRCYCKPLVDTSHMLWIREGRHPVLEHVLPTGTLVPNDLDLNGDDRQIMILTGPNMSGKSTYLRQAALIVILAQMGSYVPAAEARVGVVDQLFTRIGASDRLAEGESTFMVEMVETARILNHATPQSLIVLDEIGRGTSTYDGISIAWACLEYLHSLARTDGLKGPHVLFATHYFELTRLAQTLPGIFNAHVTAREWGDHVVFLHKVEPGPTDRAYGIHVAKLAGIPKSVLERSQGLLRSFEQNNSI